MTSSSSHLDEIRIALARAVRHVSGFRGTNRIQRWLAPPHLGRRGRRVYEMDYPIGPNNAAAGIRWLGTTQHVVGWNAYFRKAYEPETLATMAALLRPAMRVIEVGANEGYHTVFAAWCVGNSGVVHAYEPYELARTWIARNVTRLGWQDRIRLYATAVAESPRTAPLYIPNELDENQGVGGLRVSSCLQTGRVQVGVVCLDAEHENESIGFIKMDVQGGEADIIRGAARLLRRWKPVLYFEVGDAGAMDAIRTAQDHGYHVWRVLALRRPPYFTLSSAISGTWYGNCLAIHSDRVGEFDEIGVVA